MSTSTDEIVTRYDTLDGNTATTADDDDAAPAAAAADEHERQADELANLEERLEQLRERDWAAHGEALKASVEAAASRLKGLRVPVVVTVDLQTFRPAGDRGGDSWGPAERLLDRAIPATVGPRSTACRDPTPAAASGRRTRPVGGSCPPGPAGAVVLVLTAALEAE